MNSLKAAIDVSAKDGIKANGDNGKSVQAAGVDPYLEQGWL